MFLVFFTLHLWQHQAISRLINVNVSCLVLLFDPVLSVYSLWRLYPSNHIVAFFFDSIALQDLLKMVSSGKEGYGDSWCDMREKLLQIYSAALASNCGHLVEVIQVMLVCTYKGFLVQSLSAIVFVSNLCS